MRRLTSLLVGFILMRISAAVICEGRECSHGGCISNGSCVCHQCFSGATCNEYVDKHHPYFLKTEETIYIEASHKGLVYQARARDEDNYKTCLPESTLPCPCGEIAYEIVIDEPDRNYFTVNHDTGDISLSPTLKLKPGDYFKIDVATSNYKEDFPYEQNEMSIDLLTLHIRVRESNSVDELLKLYELEKQKQDKSSYAFDPVEEMKKQFLVDDQPDVESLSRAKRSAFAAVNGTTNITLEVINSASIVEPIKPGTTVNFRMTVIFPIVPTGNGMDFSVEIFAMDAVTGITTFALCNVAVVSIGSTIGPITLAQANAGISMSYNPTFLNFYDRAVIDFGTITNTASTSGGPDYSDSTIIITFSATMIPNSLFTNSTAIVTAGAEYNSDNFVWVSQASFNYTTGTGPFPSKVTITGPSTVTEFSGATYEVEAFISEPYNTIEIEVFSPIEIHDLFSVELLSVTSKGANIMCILGRDTYTYYKSVTGNTNHKATVSFPIIVSNLNYLDGLASETGKPENLIKISFTVFMYAARALDTVSIGAGLSIGTSTIWTALANVSITAGSMTPLTAGTLSALTAVAVDTSTTLPQVNMSMTATWNVKADFGSGASGLAIACTSTVTAGSTKICGVNYGSSGKYISRFPDLTDIVKYLADGSASWTIVTNTSTIDSVQTRTASQDFLSMEVTVMYLSASPSDVTVTCNGQTVTLTAAAGAQGTTDMYGVTKILGDDNIWYYKSQAGLMTTLTFPGGGIGYSDMVLETSGDFFTTAFGAQVCQVDIISIGRGIGCAAQTAATLQSNMNLTGSTNTSIYNDASRIEFGPMCGSKRDLANTLPGDFDLNIRVVYNIPPVQTVTTGTSFNLSVGVSLGSTAIWTGWADFKTSIAAPPIVTTQSPIFFAIRPTVITPLQFEPVMIKGFLKTHPGSVGSHTLTVTTSAPGIVDICRIIILNVGSNYACIDQNPYGKQNNPNQTITIIHGTSWGSTATLNLGIIRNFGTGVIEPSKIPDQDTIEIAVIVRGTLTGAGNITLAYNTNTVTDITALTILAPPTVGSDPMPPSNLNISGVDGTLDFYPDVMKQVDLYINVPSQPGYNNLAYIEFSIEPAAGFLCFAAVMWAGANIPCVVPALLSSVDVSVAGGKQVLKIDFGSICFVPISSNVTENLIQIRVGIMPAKGATSASVDATLYENNAPNGPLTITINKASGAFPNVTISASDVTLNMAYNGTVAQTVTAGQLLWLGLYITVPPGLTIPAELGIMTQSSAGHAAATIQGFRWAPNQGKNIQCLETIDQYNVTYMQNASVDNVTMLHTSQKDALVANLKYLTNNGLSYVQLSNTPSDDMAQIQALILIADHELVLHNNPITVSFAMKVGTAIIVAEQNLTMSRPATPVPVMVLQSSIAFDNSTSDYNGSTPLLQYDQLHLTIRLQHILNQSQVEAYGAIVRVMLPMYITYANTSYPGYTGHADYCSCNISSNLTATDYLDIDIDYLFFTDILECNISVTVDPYNTMPKGLGNLDSTALLRFVCQYGKSSATLQYCGATTYVNYLTTGSECFQNLNASQFTACQFLASTAIDSTVGPEKSVTATGWSPATRDSTIWNHYIIVDFLRMARITQVDFTTVAGKRSVGTYKLQYSFDGKTFMDISACTNPMSSATPQLPPLCRFQSRYVKLTILSASTADETVAIGVSIVWSGCYVDTPPTAAIPCGLTGNTTLTDTVGAWRHGAYDTTNAIVYFCDDNPKKKRMVCYSSKDGITWNALPSYIGSLRGYESTTKMMYAYDTKQVATISSLDGVNWSLVDTASIATMSFTSPSAIDGKDSASFVTVPLGPYTADFTGLKSSSGSYVVKWGSCCQ